MLLLCLFIDIFVFGTRILIVELLLLRTVTGERHCHGRTPTTASSNIHSSKPIDIGSVLSSKESARLSHNGLNERYEKFISGYVLLPVPSFFEAISKYEPLSLLDSYKKQENQSVLTGTPKKPQYWGHIIEPKNIHFETSCLHLKTHLNLWLGKSTQQRLDGCRLGIWVSERQMLTCTE